MLVYTLDEWKQQLYRNANEYGRLATTRMIPETVITQLWLEGCAPTIPDIIDYCTRYKAA